MTHNNQVNKGCATRTHY